MNMDYCKFENTTAALRQCIEAMRHKEYDCDPIDREEMSAYERRAFDSFEGVLADALDAYEDWQACNEE